MLIADAASTSDAATPRARHVWIASPDAALCMALGDRMAAQGWTVSCANSWFHAFGPPPPSASVQVIDSQWTLEAWPDYRPAPLPTVHWCDAVELPQLLDCSQWPQADAFVLKPYETCQLADWAESLHAGEAGNLQALRRCGPMLLDLSQGRAICQGRATPLQGRQLELLRLLVDAQGDLVPRAQIEDQLYRWGEELGSNAIDVHIHALRRKIGPGWIETLRARGYRLCPTGDAPTTL